jgi:t-SNARE complex subunit (syntaxin)
VENDEKDGIDEVCTMYVWVEEEKCNTQGTARHSKARRLRQKQDELVMRITIIIIIIIIISFKAVLVNVASIRW